MFDPASCIIEARRQDLVRFGKVLLLIALLITWAILIPGCASVEKTMSAVDYACVDIEMDAKTSDSGILGRGVVLPDGETLTAETIDLLCNY